MKIEWVRLAWIDLEEAVDFIARDNPEAARKMARRILHAARLLAEQPGAGRAGRVPDTRELVIGGTPFILPYRVKGNAVQILRVLNSSLLLSDTTAGDRRIKRVRNLTEVAGEVR